MQTACRPVVRVEEVEAAAEAAEAAEAMKAVAVAVATAMASKAVEGEVGLPVAVAAGRWSGASARARWRVSWYRNLREKVGRSVGR